LAGSWSVSTTHPSPRKIFGANHNFGRDPLSLHRLLPLQFRYVGLLGPKKRHAEILAQLSEYAIFDFNDPLDNLFAPAGLDIGSQVPEERALWTVAEVAAALSGRVGGFFRGRGADIQHVIRRAASHEFESGKFPLHSPDRRVQ
jgi:xanthine/CO dehydrogenase XdhC/CoxF family maturation factor